MRCEQNWTKWWPTIKRAPLSAEDSDETGAPRHVILVRPAFLFHPALLRTMLR